MTAPRLEFFFDFISPYGYFAARMIEDFGVKVGLSVNWNVMLLGVSVLKIQKLPPLPERPLVGDYHLKYAIPRFARLHGVTMNRDLAAPPVNPTLPARLFCLIKEQDPALAVAFALDILSAYWGGDDLYSDSDQLLHHARRVCANDTVLKRGLDDGHGADLLRQSVQSSLSKGVFGSPMFLIGDEPFHGVDSLPILELWLKQERTA